MTEEEILKLGSIYSKNQLTNGDAEKGDLSGWISNGVTIVDGGSDEESAKCFRLEPTASMAQDKTWGTQPPDCMVTADFLLEYDTAPDETEVPLFLQVEYEYADGTKDILVIPCVEVPEVA